MQTPERQSGPLSNVYPQNDPNSGRKPASDDLSGPSARLDADTTNVGAEVCPWPVGTVLESRGDSGLFRWIFERSITGDWYEVGKEQCRDWAYVASFPGLVELTPAAQAPLDTTNNAATETGKAVTAAIRAANEVQRAIFANAGRPTETEGVLLDACFVLAHALSQTRADLADQLAQAVSDQNVTARVLADTRRMHATELARVTAERDQAQATITAARNWVREELDEIENNPDVSSGEAIWEEGGYASALRNVMSYLDGSDD